MPKIQYIFLLAEEQGSFPTGQHGLLRYLSPARDCRFLLQEYTLLSSMRWTVIGFEWLSVYGARQTPSLAMLLWCMSRCKFVGSKAMGDMFLPFSCLAVSSEFSKLFR